MNVDSFSDKAAGWIRFTFAGLIILTAFFIRLKALPLSSGLQFLTLYPAIVLSFYICGEGPGFFSIFFGGALVFYGFFPPYFSLSPKANSIVSLSIFAFCAFTIGYALTRMHRYRRRTIAIERELLRDTRQKAERELKLVVDGARVGVWRWDLQENSLNWSDRCYQHFGIQPGSGISYQKFLTLLHPDDQDRIQKVVAQSLEKRRDYEAVYRTIWPDGSEHWIYALGRPYYSAAGDVHGMDGVLLDITEQRQTQQKAEEAASLLSAAFESISDLLLIVDREGRVVKINDTFLRLCDFSTSQDVPETIADLGPIIQVETLEGKVVPIEEWPISRGLAGERSEGLELRVKRSENPANWIGRFNVSPILNSQGVQNGAILLGHDITSLKKREAELRQSIKDLSELAEAMPQIVWTTDVQGKNTFFNSHWVEYTGLTLEESYGDGWNKPFHPDDRQRAWNAWRSAVDSNGTYSLECRLRRADGVYRWWLVRGVPAFDEKGRIYKWFGTCTDIEEIKLSEAALRAALQYSRSLIEASLDPLVTISADGRITDVNEATIKVTGATRDALIGSDFSSYFSEPENARSVYQEVYTKGFVKDYPLAIRDRSGRLTDVLYNAALYHNDNGEIAGAFAAARDITKLKRVEEELRLYQQHLEQLVSLRTRDLADANGKLEAANEELESFAYSVSHDLRVPLRAVDGFSLILLEDYSDKLDAEGKRILNVIRDGTVKLSQLIDDILSFSRAGRVEMHLSPIDMNSLVSAVLKDLEPVIAGRTLKFDIRPLENVTGDAAMLRRVWTNLIDNAIKFTARKPDALIEIGSARSTREITYYVKDNGAGFDMQYADRMFGVFQRLHGAEFPGTGIGLAIVRRIIVRHQGHVSAEGAVDKGATFFFTLPLEDHHA